VSNETGIATIAKLLPNCVASGQPGAGFTPSPMDANAQYRKLRKAQIANEGAQR
jgi:hypothetical protein